MVVQYLLNIVALMIGTALAVLLEFVYTKFYNR